MLAEIAVDLHGYYPTDITGYPYATKGSPLTRIVEQAWEMGAGSIRFIHGHGRNRGISPGFVNTRPALRLRRANPTDPAPSAKPCNRAAPTIRSQTLPRHRSEACRSPAPRVRSLVS